MSYVGKLRKKLFGVIDAICTQREKYFVSSKKNFTRSGKFKPQDIFKSLLLMESKSLSHELLPYFDYKKDSPTPSAFVQARAKIKSRHLKLFLTDSFWKQPIITKSICIKAIGFLLLMVRIPMCLIILMTLITTFRIQMAGITICFILMRCTTLFGIHILMLLSIKSVQQMKEQHLLIWSKSIVTIKFRLYLLPTVAMKVTMTWLMLRNADTNL